MDQQIQGIFHEGVYRINMARVGLAPAAETTGQIPLSGAQAVNQGKTLIKRLK